MAQLIGLGLENFRVFKEYTEFDFAPITLLTGANNSGKSSLIKALLLLADNAKENGLKELDIANKNFLGNYESIKSINSDSDGIRFSLKYSYPINENSIFSSLFTNTILTYEFDNYGIKSFVFESFVNNKYTKVYTFKRTERFTASKYWNLRLLLYLMFEEEGGITFEDSIEIIDVDKISEELNLLGVRDSEEFIMSLNERVLDLLSGHLETLSRYNELYDWINFDGIFFSYPDMVEKSFGVGYSIEEMFNESEKIYFQAILSLIGDKAMYLYLFPKEEHGAEAVVSSLVNDFNKDMEEFFSSCKSILSFQYLGNAKANIKRIYDFSDHSGFVTILKDYKKFTDKIEKNEFWRDMINANVDSINLFINSWLQQFGIGSSFFIEEEKGFGLSVSITQLDGNKMLLADLGYGYTQIIVILLSVLRSSSVYSSYSNKNNNKIIILEEPETNLHPNLQSKLADMLIDAHRTFGINFIVETHSEYLVRKLRVLTKRGTINKEDCVIYYFRNPETLQENEKLVSRIEIDSNGSLNGEFGSGFMDESDNLMIELYDLPNRKN